MGTNSEMGYPGTMTTSTVVEGKAVLSVENPKGTGRVLLFHDSFGKYGFRDAFPEVFGHITFVHDYPNAEAFKRHVEDVKPEVVIELYVERQLGMKGVRDKMLEWFKPVE